MLEVKDLSVNIGGKDIVKHVSFSVEPGQWLMLIGPNGAGKTTLLRLLAGLSFPTAGGISLFGGKSEIELCQARKRIGFLIEEPIACESFSLGRNLRREAILAGRRSRAETEEMGKLLGVPARKVGKGRYALCSLGERQRYGLAAALLGEPELLVLDEPLNGLDMEGQRDLRNLLLTLHRENGVAMLLSSHDLESLRLLATDYLFLINGRLRETLTAPELERRLETEGMKRLEEYFFRLREEEAAEEEGRGIT
jgi:ABC-2 type transport system ATP-binding protein